MALVGDDATSFTGSDDRLVNAGAVVRQGDVTTLIADQAFVYQQLVNADLAGGSWSGAASPGYHDHSGAPRGAPLGIPLSSVQPVTVTGYHGGIYDVTVSPHIGCAIRPKEIIGGFMRVWGRWPLWVPRGVGTLLVHVWADANFHTLGPQLTLSTVSGSPSVLTGVELVQYPLRMEPFGNVMDYMFEVAVDTPHAAHVLSLYTTSGGPSSVYDSLGISSIRVWPPSWRMGEHRAPTTSLLDYTTLPTPLVSGTYGTVATTFVAGGANGMPLTGRIASTLANNDGLLYEKITGKPCPGAASITNAGHDHDGTDSGLIDLPLWSTGFGPCNSDYPDGYNFEMEATGPYCVNLTAFSDTWFTLCLLPIYTPLRSTTTTDKTHWAATVFWDIGDAKGNDNAEVKLVYATSPNGAYASSTAQEINVAWSGWQYVTGTVSLNWDTLYYVGIAVRTMTANAGTGLGPLHLTGTCGWVQDER